MKHDYYEYATVFKFGIFGIFILKNDSIAFVSFAND